MNAFRLSALPARTALLAILAWQPATTLADHAAAGAGVIVAPTATAAVSGGVGAEWTVISSLNSGNAHSDLDFFERGGDYYVAVGTLAAGANDGGQMIHRLTVDGVINPAFVSAHPSAACVSSPTAATGLQHDVEVTPKGNILFNTDWGGTADIRPPQLLLDATDADGRCHDQTGAGTGNSPRGGLEIVDITDLVNPVEIALTSHIGEAHTVNVDPKRSHIAYVSSSDGTMVGIEFVDLSSCMNFPAGTSVQDKRAACRPLVYRYQFQTEWARGTYTSSTDGCHELEVYPDDTLTCASIAASIVLDMSGAYDDMGTPDDYTDDRLRGTPLPCAVRDSVSNADIGGAFATGAKVIDCVNGENGQPLSIIGWQDIGAPTVEGIELVGFINHAGSGNRAAGEDIAIAHEAELSSSGRFLIVTDERGGGIVPPGAACPMPGTNADNESGNGGIHAYAVDRLHTRFPGVPEAQSNEEMALAADVAYARTPSGEKAIYRATPRVAQESLCTAHVFQLIPGQNRMFMGWYSQGTQVVDFVEHEDGTFEWREAAWWVPESAATWTSAIFAYNTDLSDGSVTYYGATADFGRQSVDIYSITLPAPPKPLPPVAEPPAEEPPTEEPPAEEPPVTAPPPRPAVTLGPRGGAPGASLLLLALAAGLRGRRRAPG